MLEGGGEVSYEEKGTLQSVHFSEAKASCVDSNNPIKWEGTLDNLPMGVSMAEDNR